MTVEDSPIIIYGAPRSGTTYLTRILNEHPDVFISSETRIFAWLHQSLNVLTDDDRYLRADSDLFVEYLRRVYPGLIRDFYQTTYSPVRYWGDKNPHYADTYNSGCLETIVALFPDARFIHIIRDGRDVVASLVRKHDAQGNAWADLEGAHRIWINHVDIGCTFGRSLPPTQYFEVQYESLVLDDAGVARNIFDFLGIDMGEAVLNFCVAQQERRTPINGPTRDLGNDATGSDWADVLTLDEQLHSLELLWDRLIHHGYETQSSLASRRAAMEQRQRDGLEGPR